MASPFPGMDPFLEAPARWSGVHHHLLSAIAESLGDALAPAFIVAIEERVYVATPGDLLRMPWLQPDVFVVGSALQTQASAPMGGTSITPPLLIEPLEAEEVRERFLEILDVESRVVVATIEVLSPTNKALGRPAVTSSSTSEGECWLHKHTGLRSTCCGQENGFRRCKAEAITMPCCTGGRQDQHTKFG